MHRWPVDSPTKGSDAELLCFSLLLDNMSRFPKSQLAVIWDDITLMWHNFNGNAQMLSQISRDRLFCQELVEAKGVEHFTIHITGFFLGKSIRARWISKRRASNEELFHTMTSSGI